jgi:hypothetical protein
VDGEGRQDRDGFKEAWTEMASKKEKMEKAGFVYACCHALKGEVIDWVSVL